MWRHRPIYYTSSVTSALPPYIDYELESFWSANYAYYPHPLAYPSIVKADEGFSLLEELTYLI